MESTLTRSGALQGGQTLKDKNVRTIGGGSINGDVQRALDDYFEVYFPTCEEMSKGKIEKRKSDFF
jgi:hypothetical protein